MAQSRETIEIFKARDTILKQLEHQGYSVEDYTGSNISEVNSMVDAKQLDMLLTNDKTEQKTFVKFHTAKSLRINNINEYIEDLFSLENLLKKEDNFIIIMKDEPNDSLIKALKNIWEQQKIFIILYHIKRLQFNILEHTLVPPHRVLGDKEVIEIKKIYSINNDKQLPDISRFSPVSLAIGMRPGDICEIIRPSKTAINTRFYRICSP